MENSRNVNSRSVLLGLLALRSSESVGGLFLCLSLTAEGRLR